MTEEKQQEFLEQKLKEFTDKLTDAAKDVIGDVYCDYLPHVMSDTESNVAFQTAEALERILKAQFEVDGDYLVVGNVRVHLNNSYSNLCTSIYNTAQDKIENATIEELKKEVSSLKQQLLEAYRSY